MTDIVSGRDPAGQALVATPSSPQAVSTEGFDPSRFQPNSYEGKPRHISKRHRRELDALLNAVRAHIDGLTDWRKQQLFDAFMAVSPINCSWQHFGMAELFIWEIAAIAMEAREGRDAKQGSVEDDSAAIAQNKDRDHD